MKRNFLVTIYVRNNPMPIMQTFIMADTMQEVRRLYMDKGHLPGNIYIIEV